MIALTYDDGPNPRHTEELMSVLDRHGARAHVLPDRQVGRARAGPGPRARRRGPRDRQPHLVPPDDAAATSARDPRRAAALPGGGRGCRASLLEGRRRRPDAPALRAPPAGDAADVREEGYVPVLWSITCYDWRRTRDRGQLDRPRGARARAATSSSSTTATTPCRLPIARLGRGDRAHPEELGADGYGFVTVPEMVAARLSCAARTAAPAWIMAW